MALDDAFDPGESATAADGDTVTTSDDKPCPADPSAALRPPPGYEPV